MEIPINMNQPPTAELEHCTVFPRFQYSFINDDFFHDNKGIFKANLKRPNGGVQIMQTVSHVQKGYSFHDQVKFWMRLPQNCSLFARIKTGDHIKLHYDNGSTPYNKNKNFYLSLKTNRQFNQFRWIIGINNSFKDENATYSSYIQSANQICINYWYHRTIVANGRFKYGIIGALDFTKGLFTKNDILFGFQASNRTSFYLRALTENFRTGKIQMHQWRHYFDHILIDAIHKWDDQTKVGVEIGLKTRGHLLKEAIFVIQRQINRNWASKIKLTSNYDIDVLFKGPLFNYQNGKVSFGLHACNLNRAGIFKYGAQVQYNL